jgi:CTP synthase (UTP-ammonia lyase)
VTRRDGAAPDTPPPPVRLAIVGEHDPAFPPHRAVDANVAQAAAALGGDVEARWVPTDAFEEGGAESPGAYDGFWIAPGSPYRSLDGALRAIRHAREHRVPLLGTCGGSQHVVVEFARSVMGLADAQHAEIDPGASCLLVTPLTCSPAGRAMPVVLNASSRVAGWYGTTRIVEQYYCNYGVNPAYEADLHAAGLRIVGRDPAGEPRVVDLFGHPFFVGVLYVPQPSPEGGRAHPLIAAFLHAARAHAALPPVVAPAIP